MSVTIFCIMMKCGPDISDVTLTILNFVMQLIVAVMLIFTFKPTIFSIKVLAADLIKKLNKKEIISIVIFKGLVTIGGGKVLIDLLYLADESLVNSFIHDMIVRVNGPVQFMIDAVILCILCPTIDELIFRSIIFRRVARKFNGHIGIIISSILFAAINVGNGVIGAFIFGIANCIIYIKYKNILMPILINLSYNLLLCILIIPFISKKISKIVFSSANIPVSLSVGCLILILGLILFFKFFTKNKKYINDYNQELKNDSEVYNI